MNHTGVCQFQKCPLPLDFCLILCHTTSMKTKNPYEIQILSQGREPSNKVAAKANYPREIHGRIFDTETEYLDALYDFLNGN